MTIEQVEKPYFPINLFKRDRVKQLKPGDKGPFYFGGIEVIDDEKIRITGNKWFWFYRKTLQGEEINKFSVGDPFHWLPPRFISYRYKPNSKK